MGILMSNVFDPRSIIIDLQCKTKDEVFVELLNRITAIHPECDHAAIIQALREREDKMSTGISSGVAVPHAICRGLHKTTGAIAVSQTGIEYNALDQNPVYVVFMLVLCEPAKENHLHILNQISNLVHSEALSRVREAKSVEDICSVLSRF